MADRGKKPLKSRVSSAPPNSKFIRMPCPTCGGHGLLSVVNCHWLRERREQAGLSVRGMARRLGFSAPYISDVERGYRHASQTIADAYEALETGATRG